MLKLSQSHAEFGKDEDGYGNPDHHRSGLGPRSQMALSTASKHSLANFNSDSLNLPQSLMRMITTSQNWGSVSQGMLYATLEPSLASLNRSQLLPSSLELIQVTQTLVHRWQWLNAKTSLKQELHLPCVESSPTTQQQDHSFMDRSTKLKRRISYPHGSCNPSYDST